MSLNGIVTVTAQLPGQNVTAKFSHSASGAITQSESLAVAKTGTLSTRTSDTVGTLTMSALHGITDGQRIAIFWTGGCCYLATVGTVATNSVPFTTGAGDVLPIATTAVKVGVMVDLDVDFDGDLLALMLASFTYRGVVVFTDVGPAVLGAKDVAAGEGYGYVYGFSQSNPLTGNPVDKVWIANGDSTYANTFSLGLLYDSNT